MQEWWQHLPEHIDPILLIGFFSLRWYALAWLFGFAGALGFALWLARREKSFLTRETLLDLYLSLFLGVLLGGRLGYVVLYHLDFFWSAPGRIFWPYDSVGLYTGIAGMSFHGGLIGGLVALLIFVRIRKLRFFGAADLVTLSAPLAIFFGRIGNFLNLELPGRITTEPWGMVFPALQPFGGLRHPSTLYEAIGEGLLLFIFLLVARRRLSSPGLLSALFLIGYGVIRFFLEYVREPDLGASLFFDILTHGQVYSLPLIVMGVWLFAWLHRHNRATMTVQ